MIYIKVDWLHDLLDEPVVIYSELDDVRNELRKIEIYREGTVGYATPEIEQGTGLSKEPLPAFDEINSDPQFNLIEISREEFLAAWERFVNS